MYQFTTRVVLGMLLVLAIPQFAAAQDGPPLYSWVQCIDTKPGHENEYQQFTLDVTQKVLQVEDPESNRVAWYLLRSVIPAGDSAPCNFLAVATFKGFPKSSLSFGDRIKKAGVNMTLEDHRAKRNSLSSLANRELWRRVDGLEQTSEVGNYIRINLAKVHDWDAWTDLERNIWKPIAQELSKGEKRGTWGASRLVMPSGSSLPYNALSFDVFTNWDALGGGQGVSAAFQKIHPEMSSDLFSSRAQQAREVVRRDLYRVVGKIGD
jgi:hypothetical protein